MSSVKKASIYRNIERLFLWLIHVSLRVPKQRIFEHQIDLINDEFIEALNTCKLALKTSNLKLKAEFIIMIIYHLEVAATIVKMWHLWSTSPLGTAKILNNKLLAYYLTETSQLFSLLNGWSNSIKIQMRNAQDNPNINAK